MRQGYFGAIEDGEEGVNTIDQTEGDAFDVWIVWHVATQVARVRVEIHVSAQEDSYRPESVRTNRI